MGSDRSERGTTPVSSADVVASILGTGRVQAGNPMKSAQFGEPQAVDLQFWLRRRRIVARLTSFQITTAVESQPAGVVSEDTCV